MNSPILPSPLKGKKHGLTLVEVMIALIIVGVVFSGIVAGFTMSTRMSVASVAQIAAESAVESYMEQLKSMPLSSLITPVDSKNNTLDDNLGNPSWAPGGILPTQKTNATPADDTLVWSNNNSGNPTIPAFSTLTPGVTPAGLGIVDNLKEVTINPNNPGASAKWSDIWPNAITDPSTGSPTTNNIHINVWVWITDLSATNSTATSSNKNGNAQKVYGITIIYTWQYNNGFAPTYNMGVLHSIRSSVS